MYVARSWVCGDTSSHPRGTNHAEAASNATEANHAPQRPPALPLSAHHARSRLRSGRCRGPAAASPSCRRRRWQHGGGLSVPTARNLAVPQCGRHILPATCPLQGSSPGLHGPREQTEQYTTQHAHTHTHNPLTARWSHAAARGAWQRGRHKRRRG